ncbi:hypothetical protein N7495_009268 [Penicillium taxi]|uniref:uncharacterized protein n=1 Tax=Penicillium taxi TaxID=168475 RepID=UPI0025458182|nr:uncharacterized protein N7495_009268 [Penicillium taxi]KAJ5884758.1 hypothetical protein N7495_009268 [Penicillium taxi]
MAMESSGLLFKRSSSSAALDEEISNKRPKHHYNHHHILKEPVTIPLASELAVHDDAHVDFLIDRSLGQLIKNAGFDIAEPCALASLRSAAEEYLLKISTFVRQSMLSARRLQPLPQDFEHGLHRVRLSLDELAPYIKAPQIVAPIPTLLPSPPPDEETAQKIPFLNTLRQDDHVNPSYVPRSFPEFPSRHTYSATSVFTERDNDPRRIRERAAEDGRHGEEALRKLASAAFRDNPTTSSGKDKKLWGRRTDSMETMFEKTVKEAMKKSKNDPPVMTSSAMEIDSVPLKVQWNQDLGPIVNCERDYWRRTTATGSRAMEEKKLKRTPSVEPAG